MRHDFSAKASSSPYSRLGSPSATACCRSRHQILPQSRHFLPREAADKACPSPPRPRRPSLISRGGGKRTTALGLGHRNRGDVVSARRVSLKPPSPPTVSGTFRPPGVPLEWWSGVAAHNDKKSVGFDAKAWLSEHPLRPEQQSAFFDRESPPGCAVELPARH